MKLFVFTSDIQPSYFVKAKNEQEAFEKFDKGWTNNQQREKHPTFQCREVTMDVLMSITPGEFLINEDTSW